MDSIEGESITGLLKEYCDGKLKDGIVESTNLLVVSFMNSLKNHCNELLKSGKIQDYIYLGITEDGYIKLLIFTDEYILMFKLNDTIESNNTFISNLYSLIFSSDMIRKSDIKIIYSVLFSPDEKRQNHYLENHSENPEILPEASIETFLEGAIHHINLFVEHQNTIFSQYSM